MGVSKNRGTPKSSILIGFSIINHPFWSTPIFGNTHILRSFQSKTIVGFRVRIWTSIKISLGGAIGRSSRLPAGPSGKPRIPTLRLKKESCQGAVNDVSQCECWINVQFYSYQTLNMQRSSVFKRCIILYSWLCVTWQGSQCFGPQSKLSFRWTGRCKQCVSHRFHWRATPGKTCLLSVYSRQVLMPLNGKMLDARSVRHRRCWSLYWDVMFEVLWKFLTSTYFSISLWYCWWFRNPKGQQPGMYKTL